MRFFVKYIIRKMNLFSFLRKCEQFCVCLFRVVKEKDYYHIPANVDGRLILDVGANIGQSVVAFRKLFPNSKIIAIEPNPACLDCLEMTRSLVGKDRVQLYIRGAGDKRGVIDFYVPILSDGTELLQEGSFERAAFDATVTLERIGGNFQLKASPIEVITLDDIVQNVGLIKIDAQGYEYNILQGAKQIIAQSSPIIILERDERNEEKIGNFLAEFGYSESLFKVNVIYQKH